MQFMWKVYVGTLRQKKIPILFILSFIHFLTMFLLVNVREILKGNHT